MCLFKILPDVPGMCNRSSVTEAESNDGRIRGESYKVCFTSLMLPCHRTGESCMILMVGWATLLYHLYIGTDLSLL